MLARDGVSAGWFALTDATRPGAREAVQALRASGVAVEILSGDREAAVAGVAWRLGVKASHAALLPEDKVDRLNRLKGEGHRA